MTILYVICALVIGFSVAGIFFHEEDTKSEIERNYKDVVDDFYSDYIRGLNQEEHYYFEGGYKHPEIKTEFTKPKYTIEELIEFCSMYKKMLEMSERHLENAEKSMEQNEDEAIKFKEDMIEVLSFVIYKYVLHENKDYEEILSMFDEEDSEIDFVFEEFYKFKYNDKIKKESKSFIEKHKTKMRSTFIERYNRRYK